MLTDPLSRAKVNQALEPFQNHRIEAWGRSAGARRRGARCGCLSRLVQRGGFLDIRLAALPGAVCKGNLCSLELLLLPGSFLKRFAERLTPGSWLVKPAWSSRLVQWGESVRVANDSVGASSRLVASAVRGHYAICAAACRMVGSPPGSA